MSITQISFLKYHYQYNFFAFSKCLTKHLYFSDPIEINQFLRSLERFTVYVVSLELYLTFDISKPCITLSEPILITRNSNSTLLSLFILEQIEKAENTIGMDYNLFQKMNILKEGPPFVLIRYNSINLF